jgi:hypothetical protein
MSHRAAARRCGPPSIVIAVVLAAVACGSGSASRGPASTAASYVESVLGRDGETLCPLLDAGSRYSVDRIVAAAREDPTFRGPADCPHVMHLLIGYPKENMGYRFTGGELLSVGRTRTVALGRRRYVGVDVRVRLRTEKNGGYAPLGTSAPSPTLTDTVWLGRAEHGWRTAKASLTLTAALDGDILRGSPLERANAQRALQPPTR